MKQFRITILLTGLMSMFGAKAFAHDIEVANKDGVTIYYEWINNNTELAVSYRGDTSFEYHDDYSGNVDIPESVVYEGQTYSVTSIGGDAFIDCFGLNSVTIPNSVTSIGDSSFQNCKGLTSVTIPNSVTSIDNFAFRYCSSLTSVTIPNSVTFLGNYAFDGCSSLTSVTIPNSVTTIFFATFHGCSGLTSVTIPNSVTTIEGSAFRSSGLTSVTIPNSVTLIGNWAFEGCSSLTSVTIPNSVTKIESGAFDGCRALSDVYCFAENVPEVGNSIIDTDNNTTLHVPAGSIDAYKSHERWNEFKKIVAIKQEIVKEGVVYEIEDGHAKVTYSSNASGDVKIEAFVVVDDKEYEVTAIDGGAFVDCTEMLSVEIPNTITSIGIYAFYGCRGLTSVTIPNSVTTIATYAFSFCRGLTSIKVEEGNVIYDSRDNCNAIINTSDNKLVLGCQNTVIPSSVTSIGEAAFYGCRDLTSFTIPNNVTSIGKEAFYQCSGLTSVTISNGVTSIGQDAFYECTGLTSVTIPNSVTSIGSSAFIYCSSLTSVTIPNSVTTIDGWAFLGCSSLTSVTIPNSVTTINSSVFESCHSLTSVTIPNSVTTIEKEAFSYCSSLTSVTIPNSVTLIGKFAFSACNALKEVYCLAEKVPYTDPDAFSDLLNTLPIEQLIAYVPAGSVDAYRSTEPWSGFGSIVGISETGITNISNDTQEGLIYNLNGNRLKDMSKGINLIRQKDGRVIKVLKK